VIVAVLIDDSATYAYSGCQQHSSGSATLIKEIENAGVDLKKRKSGGVTGQDSIWRILRT